MTENEWNALNQSLLIYSVLGSTEGSYYYQTSTSQVHDMRYKAVQAHAANSGLSFGMFQQDVAANDAAKPLFKAMVDEAISSGRITAEVGNNYKDWAEIAWSEPSHHVFTSTELTDISTNILAYNKGLIDAGDSVSYTKVLTEVGNALNAGNAKWGTLGVFDSNAPDYKLAVGLISSWSNRSGGLGEFTRFMSGETIRGQTLTSAPTLNDVRDYMQNTAYFKAHPGELATVEGNIGRGYNLYNASVGAIHDIDQYLKDNPPLLAGWVPEVIGHGTWDPVQQFMDFLPKDWCGLDLPDWAVPAGGIFGDVPAIPILRGWGDPLVLDLDGDGVEVTKMGFGTDRSMVYFDMDNDGFAERTAWATGGDGLLALDKNGNGKIDNQGELFGNTNTLADGFLNLKQYDSNADNKITSADAQFANLRVWVDADKDGQTDAGELKTLADLKITQINLGATILSNVSNNENTVAATSSFVMNGVTKTISEVWFRNDAMDTRYLGDVTLDVRTLFLPTLKGFGNLKDLHVAMSQDTALLTLVQNFTAGWSTKKFENPTALNNEVRAILYKWAGVDTVVDGSRGTFIDAKILSFMEALTGEPYGSNSTLGFTQPSHAVHVPPVMNAFEIAFDSLKAHLLTQAGAGSLFVAAPVYNIASGDLSAGELSLSAINALRTEALTLDSSARGGFWSSVAEYVLNVRDKASLSTAEVNALNSAIVDSGIGQTWESVSNAVLAQYPSSYRATNLSDYVLGGQGNDGLNGLAGDDVIGGLTGNDNLSGGAGSDTYKFSVGDGVDTLYEESGAADTILMGAGITAANIRFEKSSYDLNIYYGTSDKITLYSQFYDDMMGSSSLDEVETLKFADGSTINLKSGLTFTGTAAADSLAGTSMADSLVGLAGDDGFSGYAGDDVLIGGTGNDHLSGGAGSDTYKFSVGDGVDTISETSGAADVILMGTGITAANIRFEKSSYDLNIYYGTSDKITLYSQFYDDMMGSSSLDEVETLKFADGSTINLKSGLTFTGTAAADSVVGTSMADTLVGLAGDDGFSGYAGDDVLIGGTGNDNLSGGAGSDTYKFSVGDGVDTISETSGAADVILMGTGITAANIRFEKSSYDLNIYYGTSDKITLYSQFYDDMMGSSSCDEVETLKFADGSTINLKSGLTFTGTAAADSVVGTSMADTLVGLAGDDNLSANGGDDVLIGGTGNDYFYGGAGSDTYKFAIGDGVDVIADNSGAADVILMGAGITAANIRFEKSSYDLNIYYGTSDKITLSLQFYDDMMGSSSCDEVETLKFADGSTINLKSGLTFTGTAAADSVVGTSMADTLVGLAGNDGFSGYGGDDVLIGGTGNDYLSGGAGSDTYKFSVGDGVDIIYEETGVADVVLMGAGITAANIRFEKSSYDLNIYYGTSDKITLSSQFYDDMRGSSSYDEVETLKFADGSTINLKSGLTFTGTAAADSVVGTSMADSLVGLAGDDNLSANGGDDVLIGGTGNDYFYGGAGSDTYKFAIGDGVDVIADNSGAADVILMGAGITAANIRFEKSSYDLNIYYGTSDKITLSLQFYDDMMGSSSCDEVETLKFADGSTINLKSGLTFTGTTAADSVVGTSMTDTLVGLAGDDYLYSYGGDDVLIGGAGNDYMDGGLGVDTASYAGTSAGVTVSLLTTAAQNTVGSGADTLAGIENLLGSSYNDTLTGDANANVINGGSGNDVLLGKGGTDTLYGGLGADSFKFDVSAVGNIDTVKDFKLAEADKLDIRDLLVGYDSLTKAITDFVECTTSGANTIVKVDRDGAGATYSWQQIAVLENVTGLTDEATLKASGTLIA